MLFANISINVTTTTAAIRFLRCFSSVSHTVVLRTSYFTKINMLTAFFQLLVVWQKWKAQQDHASTAIADVLKEIIKKMLQLDDDIFMQ